MDNYEVWLKNILDKSKGYKEIQCTLLVDNKCSVYQDRPNCCCSYPRTDGFYCSTGDCAVLKRRIKNNTEESNSACFKCKDICCNHILVPDHVEITAEFLKKWMDIDCNLCKKYFG